MSDKREMRARDLWGPISRLQVVPMIIASRMKWGTTVYTPERQLWIAIRRDLDHLDVLSYDGAYLSHRPR